jgi:PAS domain S-box-containing protein
MKDDAIPNASEERYRAFTRNSSEGIWRLEFQPPLDTALSVHDQIELAYRHGRLAECNLAMARMYGLTSIEELIGQGLDAFLPASDPQARAYLASIVEAGYTVSEVESVERGADGEPRYFVNSMTGIVEEGQLLRIWGTRRDITAQKRVEEALRQSEERFRRMAADLKRENEERAYLAAIVESSDDAIIAKDLDGIVRSMNAAAERLLGYTAAELVGRPIRTIIPFDRQSEEDDIISRIRRGEPVDHFETVRQAKDGRLIDVSLTVSPVRDSSGRVVGASKIARDITDQRRLAEERDRLLEAERVARAEAERASRVKDEFVAMVSHELRTPLNAILGWTQLMTRSSHDPALIQRGLEVVTRNTRLQAQLISDLLDISRIVAGKLSVEMESVDLVLIVKGAIETIEGEGKAKGVVIEKSLADAPTMVVGDPARLQQVVWNLLSNAIKFTPSGGRVRVSLGLSGNRAEIAVTDDGAGIRADFLPHVFDRFHQADRSITRRFGGLGLGLSIVKHLVDVHGGTVRAESPGEGQGATFTISLPTSAGVTPYDRRSRPPAAPEPETPALLDTIRVLVVEDERDTMDFLIELLEAQGATVLSASTAREGLSLVRDEAPDVLISDIGLPEMDGYDFIQHVRRESVPAHGIPAIALTAYARAEDRMRALRAGFQAHMAKPVEAAELIATVASFVELTGERRAP